MNNLFLIGMMGSWKSTVGRKLAKKLKMKFIDIDDAIEDITDMKITEIFTEFGEPKFREMESAFFIEKAKFSDQVFSTGGGIILNPQNRNILKELGTTFLLNASTNVLVNRIKNTNKRPLLNGSNNLHIALDKIWSERKEYYKNYSHFIIETDDLTPTQVLDEILEKLEVPFGNN